MTDRLVFVPVDQALVVEVAELGKQTERESRPGWHAPAAIVIGSDGPRVFGRDAFRAFLADYFALPATNRTAERLAGLLRALPRAPVAAADTAPGRPAVVLDDQGHLIGAWAPAASRRRGGGSSRARSTGGRSHATEYRAAPPYETGGPFRYSRPSGGRAPAPDAAPPPAVEAGAEGSEVTAAVEPTEPPSHERLLERTPHVDAPDRVATEPGTRVPLEVWVDTEQTSAVEHGTRLSIALPPGVDELVVGVLVTVSSHFAVEGRPYQQLTIREESAASERLQYELTVTGEGQPGLAGVDVLLEYRGRTAATVRRAWTWTAGGAEAEAKSFAAEAEPGMALDATAEQPDLSVFITAPENDDVTFACSVQTPLLDGYAEPTPAEPFKLPQRADQFVVTKLEAIANDSTTREDRARALRAAGIAFWEAVPPVFRDVLFALEDSGRRPRHLFVASIEPNLPWELMIPSRLDAQGIARDWPRPLGAELAMGRWTRENLQVRDQRLVVRNAFVVAPDYPGERKLDASQEIELLADRLAGVRVEPASIAALDRRFAEEPASVLHFVCHGAAGIDDDDAIYLDRDEKLSAGEARVLEGFKALCGEARPLVFLNACEAGRNMRGLAGATGFPRAFGDLGARAIIAPLWPVDDTRARDVALEVYRRALDAGIPLAEIVREIRARAYDAETFDDSLAAYCFYGDPLTTLERVS